MAGPLRPQCVKSKGPRCVPTESTVTAAFGTETPARDLTHGTSMWKVKRDGTGGSKVCSSETASAPRAGVRQPPVARRSFAQEIDSPEEVLSVNPESVFATEVTARFVDIWRPAS